MQRIIGLVLHRRNIGSSDRRIVILSTDGKHEVRARGTQKLSSKLAGSLEPLTLVDLTLVHGRGGEQVTGSSIRDSYRDIHGNVTRIAAASLLAAATDQLVRGRLEESNVLKVLREAFALLGRSRTNRNVLLATAYGLWNILSELGYQPDIEGMKASNSVKRLLLVITARNPNLMRRVRCTVGTARQTVVAAVYATTVATDREVPAAAFFWQAIQSPRYR